MGQVVQLEDIRKRIAKAKNAIPCKSDKHSVGEKGVEVALNEAIIALHELRYEAQFKGFVEAIRRM